MLKKVVKTVYTYYLFAILMAFALVSLVSASTEISLALRFNDHNSAQGNSMAYYSNAPTVLGAAVTESPSIFQLLSTNWLLVALALLCLIIGFVVFKKLHYRSLNIATK